MQINWAYQNCGDGLKNQIRQYAEKKLPRLERLLVHVRPSLQKLSAKMYRTRQATGNHSEMRLVLELPSRTLATQELADTWWEAVDVAFDELLRQLRRHQAKLRGDWVYRRRNHQREELSAAGAGLRAESG